MIPESVLKLAGDARVKLISGTEGYFITDNGRVISIINNRHGINQNIAHIRKGVQAKNGYQYVSINRKTTPIHILVLTHFGSEKPLGHVCCHNDGDKLNNHISNLRWGTYSDNSFDTRIHGTFSTPPGGGKLSIEQVREIRIMLANRVPTRKIARHFGIAQSTVNEINWGKVWRWLK